MSVSQRLHGVFPRPRQRKIPQKYPSGITHVGSTHFNALIRRFFKKRVFTGEKGHDPEQSKDLETRINTPRGTPKNTIQCKNSLTGIPNFEWRAALGVCFPQKISALAAGLPCQDHVYITADNS